MGQPDLERRPAVAHGTEAAAPRRWSGRYRRLFWRIFLTNAAALLFAAGVAVAVFSKGSVSSPFSPRELSIVVAALAAMGAWNLILTQRMMAPIDELVSLMRTIDPLRRGQRVPVHDRPSEATELATAFNDMLQRLEDERANSARRTLNAQEAERLRVAQELHDEVGQNLTAALLQLSRVRKRAPAELEADLTEASETVRENLEELRRIAQRLRPQALEELGLGSALTEFIDRLEEQTGLAVDRNIDMDLPPLLQEQELVLYRVTQEALTNVIRHAHASAATISLAGSNGLLELRVSDNGVGLGGADPGSGIQGMRERAAIIDAELGITAGPDGGTEVALRLPLDEAPQ